MHCYNSYIIRSHIERIGSVSNFITVVIREAKEKAASGAPMDLRLKHVSILQEQMP